MSNRIRGTSINPLLTLDIPNLEGLVAIPELIVIHKSWTLVSWSFLVEFRPSASAIRTTRDLSKYLTISTLLSQLGLVTCSGLIIERQQLLEWLYTLAPVFFQQLLVFLHLLWSVCMDWGCLLCLLCLLLFFLGRFRLTGITIIPIGIRIWFCLLFFARGRLRLHELISSLQSLLLSFDMCQHQIKIFLAGIYLIQVINLLYGIDILKFGLKLEAVQVVPVGGAETTRIDVIGQPDWLLSDFLFAGSAEGSASGGVGCLDLLGVVGAHEGGMDIC